jgi:ribosome-binding factor A
MPSIKQKRIASEMVRVISTILAEEARDELLKTITITGCDVASDLSQAKVYFTSLSEMSHKDLERELEEASSYVRTLVAEKMDLRNTPKLKFIYDESVEYGNNIERILNNINND